MRAGKLRHRLEIRRRNTDRSEIGAVSTEYSTIDTVWGSVVPLNGRELLEADRVEARVTHMVETRYRADVSAADQIVHNGRELNVESVINIDERNIRLQFLCREAA